MKVHFVHGIMDPVGTSGLLKLVPYFQRGGFDCRVPDYGLITALETNVANPLLWRTLLPYVEPGDLYIGHSNGCAIGYDLVLNGARPAGLVLINAALRRDITLPAGMWADCYYNAGDDATVAAAGAVRLGLVDKVWGEMGHAGPLSSNPAITGIDCGKPGVYAAVLPPVSGHSDLFTDGKVQEWAPYIFARAKVNLHLT